LRYLPRELLPDASNWSQLDVIDLQKNPWACDCHNEWMADTLIRQIRRATPELADGVLCWGPTKRLAGKPMWQLMEIHPGEVPCPQGDNFNPYKENYGVDPREARNRGRVSVSDSPQDRLAVGVAVGCLATVALAACFVGGLWAQKRRQRRYRAQASAGGVSFTAAGHAVHVPADGPAPNPDANHEDIVRRLGGL